MRLISSMYVSRLISRNSKILCTSSLQKTSYKFLRYFVCLPVIETNTGIRKLHLLKQNADRSERRYMSAMITIKHDDDSFYIDMQDERVFLKYNIQDNIMEITQTKVPKALAGHGLGKLVAKAALEYAVKNNLKIRIMCGFVKYYVKKYEPEYLEYII